MKIMTCKGCGNVRERLEDFYNLSLEVKDQKSVYTALEKLIQKDLIQGYQCDGCNQKVDLENRTLLH